jgi:hypothetical protein
MSVLAELILVRRERHVAAVADDVEEAELGEVAMEEGQEIDAARLLPTPRTRRGFERSTVLGEDVGQVVEHRGLDGLRKPHAAVPEVGVDPAVGVVAEPPRVFGLVQIATGEEPCSPKDAGDDARSGSARGADDRRARREQGGRQAHRVRQDARSLGSQGVPAPVPPPGGSGLPPEPVPPSTVGPIGSASSISSCVQPSSALPLVLGPATTSSGFADALPVDCLRFGAAFEVVPAGVPFPLGVAADEDDPPGTDFASGCASRIRSFVQ